MLVKKHKLPAGYKFRQIGTANIFDKAGLCKLRTSVPESTNRGK